MRKTVVLANKHCPHCGVIEKIVHVKSEKTQPYHCGDRRKYFSVKMGTIMASSNLSLRKWVIGIYLISTSLKGVSIMKLHRDLSVTWKTAWMMDQKIRQGEKEGKDKLGRTVEMDEATSGELKGTKARRKKPMREEALQARLPS